MTREEAKQWILDHMAPDDDTKQSQVMRVVIKNLEAWEEVKQDLYKFARDSFDAECAECYRIALRCVEGHLKEVTDADSD